MTTRTEDLTTVEGNDSAPEDMQLLAEVSRVPFTEELGATGLKRSGGYLDEEFLPQLRGRKAVSVYAEMTNNDPIVGALMFAIERLIRNVDWRVDPAGKSKQQTQEAEFLESCIDDMEQPFSDTVAEILSCLPHGWAWHETVFKRRGGLWTDNPREHSKHSDGLIGWAKMPIRSQETLLRWMFDDRGETIGMVQMAPPHYRQVVIPRDRSLLFRFGTHKGNPEGRSMLRNAYRPWFFKKRLEEIEAVGIERDLAGLPMVKLPAEMLKAKAGSDTAKQVEQFKKMVKSVRRNEQEGIVFPAAYDQDTKKPLYEFELLGGGGSRAFNVDATIRRYEERILGTVLADFILVGHQPSGGSYSLHTDKTGIFRTALNSVTQMIADVLNRQAVPRLFKANGMQPDELPKIVPSDVDAPDITQLASFMSSMSGLGIQWFPDPAMENFVRQAARLPELGKEEEERRRQLQMRSEATAFAAANTEYLMARQQMQTATVDPGAAAAQQQAAQGGGQPGAQPGGKQSAA